MVKNKDMGMMVVSHYERFFQLLVPTHTHIMIDGQIVMDSDASLVSKIDAEGYEWIANELGIQIVEEGEEKPKKQVVSVGSCAVNESTKGARNV